MKEKKENTEKKENAEQEVNTDGWERKQCTKHAELELMKRLFNVVERNYHMTSEP